MISHELRTPLTSIISFTDLILASGSAPSRLPVPGAELAVTSHDLFRLGADLDIPARPVIIGGGYIGMETAAMLSALGVAPVVLELTGQLLPGFDPDLARFLERSVKDRIRVELGTAVTGIERSGSGLVVRYRRQADGSAASGAAGAQGSDGSVEADLVVMAAGRVPVLPEGYRNLSLDLGHHGAPAGLQRKRRPRRSRRDGHVRPHRPRPLRRLPRRPSPAPHRRPPPTLPRRHPRPRPRPRAPDRPNRRRPRRARRRFSDQGWRGLPPRGTGAESPWFRRAEARGGAAK